MLPMKSISRTCPSARHPRLLLPRRCTTCSLAYAERRRLRTSSSLRSGRCSFRGRSFTNSANARQDDQPTSGSRTPEEIEQIVRDAAQRFRGTLPKGYLDAEEYALYERLYGPPLRETEPEDVGIHTHVDLDLPKRNDNERTLLRTLENGQVEEVSYEVAPQETEDLPESEQGQDVEPSEPSDIMSQAQGYVDAVARSEREHAALLRLAQDFERAQKNKEESIRLERQERRAELEAEEQRQRDVEAESEPLSEEGLDEELGEEVDEDLDEDLDERQTGASKRYHPHTLQGKFYDKPVEILLPRDELVDPISDLLSRTHISHIKTAAEKAFGGMGLPNSPATPVGLRIGRMTGVGLPPDSRQMSEIEADAFLAGYMPPAYASVLSVLREVRKRVGSEWLQSRLKQGAEGGLSILDAGAGGAGLVAWEQILRAEWDVLRERGEVRGSRLPQWRKTAIAASDRLRNRLKALCENTTFLPRLPDYEHSGATEGEHIDAGSTPQPRKQFDIIIASHLFMNEEVGHRRQAVLNNLWSALNKDGGILIVIEKAHPRGFEAMAHVRDTVLTQFLLPQSGQSAVDSQDQNPAYNREREPGHVIAPCTSQGPCPMYKSSGESSGRKDYCHFHQRFVQPSFYRELLGRRSRSQGDVEFSYVAIRRGVPRDTTVTGKLATAAAFGGYNDPSHAPDMQSLPRLILRPLKRQRHVTLDLCTAEGKLERWTIPKSYGKQAYHDARKSEWGDLWALGAKTRTPRRVRAGTNPGNGSAKNKRFADGDRKEPRDRRQRGSKKVELLRSLQEAERQQEELISQQIDEELGQDFDEVDDKGSRR